MNQDQKDKVERSAQQDGWDARAAIACQQTADDLRRELRAEFTVVIAYRGGEFFVGAQVPTPETLPTILERLLETLRQPNNTLVNLREDQS